jgi:hypothetical protein
MSDVMHRSAPCPVSYRDIPEPIAEMDMAVSPASCAEDDQVVSAHYTLMSHHLTQHLT